MKLIKHDFSTIDIFGKLSQSRSAAITGDGWSFHDRSRTGAEIVRDFYKTILEAAGDCLILGCNTLSHLSAGLVHINRIGDDTSGKDWERTFRYGVNTLAFRLAQHNRFYAADADCVGILPGKIPWEKNRQWLELLANSGTPLFVSCAKGALNPEQFAQVQAAYRRAAAQTDVLVPLDWETTRTPEKWLLNGTKELSFQW